MTAWHIVLALVALATSLVATRATREIALRKSLLDRPNDRSAHVRPTPRLGGIGIMSGFVPAACAMAAIDGAPPGAWVIVGATAFISCVGLLDDLRPLPARARFLAQLVAAVAVVGSNPTAVRDAWTLLPLPLVVVVPVSVLWIVWVTNLYNFMDGIDGIAGGQAVIGGVAIAGAALAVGGTLQGGLALAMAAAALGFLALNFPPASIFMGDVGSTPIGFLFASIPFVQGSSAVPAEVVLLALGLFIFDATTTLVRRLMRRERFFQAHRTHWYQRPLAFGVQHRAITLASYPGMMFAGAMALAYPAASTGVRWVLVGAVVAAFAAYVRMVLSLERRRRSAVEGQEQP
jgi:UDP-N-acetylmuramyl pentapeptide phosphotransferase/UDP-N-acetylglucosamine-1-phosphate transferase